MKIVKDEMMGSKSLDIWRFNISFYCQWREFPNNWMNLDIIKIAFENASYKKVTEIYLSLFGFCFYIDYYWQNKHDSYIKMMEWADGFKTRLSKDKKANKESDDQ